MNIKTLNCININTTFHTLKTPKTKPKNSSHSLEQTRDASWHDCGVSERVDERDSFLRGVWEREAPWWRVKARLDMGERSVVAEVTWGDSDWTPLSTVRYRTSRLLMIMAWRGRKREKRVSTEHGRLGGNGVETLNIFLWISLFYLSSM